MEAFINPEDNQRLVPTNAKTRKQVLEHWHQRKTGICGPLKSMKIQKVKNRRDYKFWHNRRAIALAHAKLGEEKCFHEIATDEEGKPRELQEQFNRRSRPLRQLQE